MRIKMFFKLLIFLSALKINLTLEEQFKIVILLQNDQEIQVREFEDVIHGLSNGNEITINRVNLHEEDNEEEQLRKICDSLANGFNLILDFSWTGSEITQDLVNNMSLPYLHIDVSIAPFLTLLDSYLDSRNSTDVLAIFDTADYIDQALYYWIDSPRLRMVMAEPLDKTAINKILEIRPIPASFVIMGTTEDISKIILQIFENGLLELSDRWNLVFTDFKYENFDRQWLLNQNFTISLLYLNRQLCHDMVEKNLCPNSFNLISQFIKLAAISIQRSIAIIIQNMNISMGNFQCGKSDYPAEIRDNFYNIIEAEINEKSNILNKIGKSIRVKVKGTVEKAIAGNYEIIAEYKLGHLQIEPGKQFHPIKAFYRIGITHALPWSYKEINPETGIEEWTGYCVDFVEKLAEVMNFSYQFVEPKTGTFGEKIDGKWDGVVGDLAVGDTDIAVTAIIMTADKEEVVDFVAPYYEQTGITIVMRKPVRKTSLFKFMTVLKEEVWLSIVAALILTGFMIWFLDKYSPYSAKNNKEAYPYPCRDFTLKESFWFALTSFTPQGGGEAPKALSGRTLVAAYWLFVVLMLATFTANLAAFLTVERMQAPVQSLEQLARQSRINYTVVHESETHKYFINMKFAEDTLYTMWKELTLNASTDDTRYRVWDYPIREQYGHILLAINDSNPVINASEGFRITNEHLEADYAFIHDSSEVRYEISKNCNLTEVGEVFAEKPYAVAVQQGSHLQDDLSKVILDLQKDRFFERLQAKYWNHSNKGDCPTIDDNEGITLQSLGGVFIATLFGLAIAMVTLVGEVIYYRRKAKNGNNKRIKLKKSKMFANKISGAMPSNFEIASKNLNTKNTITIGSQFNPINNKRNLSKELENINISQISLFPSKRTTMRKSVEKFRRTEE